MGWGHKNRKGAREGSKSDQFRGRGKKGGGVTHDGRCATCGGNDGRHNQVRVSRTTYDKHRVPNGHKIVFERCPNA